MFFSKTNRKNGFTIVELLVVIIVIAILASIAIVAYNGITREAATSVLKADLRTAADQINIETVAGGGYPSSLNDVNNGEGLQQSEQTTFTYSSDSSSTFCLTAVSNRYDELIFHVDQTGSIKEGVCPGQVIAFTPEGCFSFNATYNLISDYYNNEQNNSSNPACPREVLIPSSINGVTVTTLGASAFSGNQLTSVTIPNTVTSIGALAFHTNQLTSVTIPNSTTNIAGAAFMNNQLSSVTISNSLTSISSEAFKNNQLTSITIPNSVTSIGNAAFEGNQITSVILPNSVTSIGNRVFQSNQLSSVTLSSSLTSIGMQTFAFNQLSSVTIPNSVVSIDVNAFAGNSPLTCNIPTGKTFADTGCNTIQYY